jgi:hypothetical protein
MTETKLPTSEAELRGLLEQAMEYGKQQAQKAGPTQEPDTPALNVDSLRVDALREEFNTRVTELMADRKKAPFKFRALQAEYVEKGLSAEDVDLNPPAPDWHGRGARDWPPPTR